MCIMEEMQWMRTRPISAANFFHGTLEVIERDIPVILIKGEDMTRPEMDRVEKFVNTISANVTVFDTKDFELKGISDEFRGMLSPIVMRSAFQRVSIHLEHNRRHPLAIRRYYRRLDYTSTGAETTFCMTKVKAFHLSILLQKLHTLQQAKKIQCKKISISFLRRR